ncbi:unnamed protein product, partial [Vitis vinifera]|uniref:Uncharacterized protein n=1 Tax=Vitis vinifera TaxID=29760 RepID=D7TAJ2_VITVI
MFLRTRNNFSFLFLVRHILALPKQESEGWRHTSIFQITVQCGNKARKLDYRFLK